MPAALVTLDGNEAVASVAHRLSEVIAIYPITPATAMGELSDEWSAHGRKNLWGMVPRVVEMQSEAGAAGAVHGALQAGALATTFTASQGLLLMIPNLYKIAGELTPFCLHVAARTLATHALSIFGDHSDVMACRQTGFALLASGSVQEAQDLACVAHAATLESRVPFLHFFDGFRTSHEISKIARVADEELRGMISEEQISAHRRRALTPDHPVIRGTAQNPDTFFQAREAASPYPAACPEIVQGAMDRFAGLTGRQYHLFDYYGHPEAERVVVLMGSAAETVQETVDWLRACGERVGVLRVRLFRPFSARHFLSALPGSVRAVAVLDRTKEPGALGDPLYMDVVTALREAEEEGGSTLRPRVVGGRYGLSSKEFTPAMVKAVFDELARERPRNHFTIGINDDVSGSSLPYDAELDIEAEDVVRAVFYGLGSDGTVGSNKNSIKIIGEGTEHYAQAYFVYDSKKSGAVTVSHLRFGPRPIRSTYLIRRAGFVACHQPHFLERLPVLESAAPGAVFLLNTRYGPAEVWAHLPRAAQEQILEKRVRFYVIDAYGVAEGAGLGRRLSTVMQACFFALSGVLPLDEAIAKIKAAATKAYAKKGAEVVERNLAAIDAALSHLHEVRVPEQATSELRLPSLPEAAPEFVRRVTAAILRGEGDRLPVSAFPPDGTWPVGTSKWEKRRIAQEIPAWEPALCIECNKCVLVCPHAAIRAKVAPESCFGEAPAGYPTLPARIPGFEGERYALQVAPEDCTGCTLCVNACPAHDKNDPARKALVMAPIEERLEVERPRWEFFERLPEVDRTRVAADVRGVELLEPLFEFSGACTGCGETPYIKLLTQLFGDRALIANATGCSSIFGGNLPTTPYTTDPSGRGPAWANSLFEDNAEFGLGMRLAVDQHEAQARALLERLAPAVGQELADAIRLAEQESEAGIAEQRARVATLKERLAGVEGEEARRLALLADYLVRKSVWLVGGDGWAYDIGYGGLDHVLASGQNVNVLVLDTEVYSNTGGQASKATPLGATAKFAAAGKAIGKKDLGLQAMTYGHVYVARVAMGAKDLHTLRAFQEAEAYPGPSLIIAYGHCIAHGCDMGHGAEQQKLAVESGVWPLYRFDPRRTAQGEPPLHLDSSRPKKPAEAFMRSEGRFTVLQGTDPERFEHLLAEADRAAEARWALYEQLAQVRV
jgi:pyruvate-ferredoxin/flavodoxin oxidoreductase